MLDKHQAGRFDSLPYNQRGHWFLQPRLWTRGLRRNPPTPSAWDLFKLLLCSLSLSSTPPPWGEGSQRNYGLRKKLGEGGRGDQNCAFFFRDHPELRISIFDVVSLCEDGLGGLKKGLLLSGAPARGGPFWRSPRAIVTQRIGSENAFFQFGTDSRPRQLPSTEEP